MTLDIPPIGAPEERIAEMDNSQLTPPDVIAMPLDEFEKRFGWRPVHPFEKKYFAITTKRPGAIEWDALRMGIIEEDEESLSKVMMK